MCSISCAIYAKPLVTCSTRWRTLEENYDGWAIDENQMKFAREKLDRMSKDAVMSDAEGRSYLESDRYHVVIHDNVATCANVLNSLTLAKKG